MKKRMETRMRKLKKNVKGKILDDGKPISGKNRSTDTEIAKFSSIMAWRFVIL